MENNLLSVILLSYYSKNRIITAYEKLSKLFEEEKIPFEFIVMDDGSKDESYGIACDLEKQHDNVRAYKLARNYGSMYSMFAGLSKCNGACAVHIPDDEQQPYDTLVKMYRLWQEGYKIIVPYRVDRDDSKVSAFFSNSYYKLMNAISDVQYPMGGADLAFVDREVIDLLVNRIHARNTMFIAEVLGLGFDPFFLPYHRPLGLNEGKSHFTFKKKLKLAFDSLFSNSTLPLRMITYMGLSCFVVSVIAFIFYFYIAAFGNRVFWGMIVPGWASLFLLILLLGGLVLMSIGIVSEYIWRIFDEVKDRPGYIIKKK